MRSPRPPDESRQPLTQQDSSSRTKQGGGVAAHLEALGPAGGQGAAVERERSGDPAGVRIEGGVVRRDHLVEVAVGVDAILLQMSRTRKTSHLWEPSDPISAHP